MAYQTYGRMEKLIVSAAMSQGGVEVKLSSSTDFTFSITDAHKTERYTVENNRISQLVWTEWTANGEDENTWNYFWNVTDVTFPDLTDGWALAE